ncbi:HTH-type transcriptional regulator MalT (plasmid) [Peptoclostridium acidaminophilum DSM 3953]|uniref:HTH-type transcriptional regulator MalT n=1 Tax=Peptoclostridium acidaminophilum DSM 3953 TaxID=1286171 RepID=W8T7T4_PEPAC|nr:LuxR C-terminal-related transcriptional regulator [Peptoclostridium acidaminophilum]AHM57794.1 HTH-type transcriptional regulator MalT [Peptoclostridium acidaminophilum DSM 3953]
MANLNKNKFMIPRTKSKMVERESLLSKLDNALGTKLTILWAPAGSGKTTAIVSWLESRNLEGKTAWISLDERDDNPELFWSCFEYAAGKIMRDEPQPGNESSVEAFLNAISESDSELLLVMDDFHFIKNAEILRDIKHLIDDMGSNIHIIITSRTKVNLSLARLRLSGEVTEIDRKDMAFDYRDAGEFLRSNTKLKISEKNVKLINDRTEGWAAGIQMAMLSLKEKKDLAELEEKFNGCSGYVEDYFSEEIFNEQPEEIKDFLLKTCILDELVPGLCSAVSGRKDSQELLEHIYDSNLFVDKQDYDEKIFRYNTLFKEFLLCKSKGMNLDAVYEASNRAAKWYRESGVLNKAINQYIEVGNLEPVIDLVESECIRMVLCSEQSQVFHWLESIPQDIILKKPRLCIANMFIHICDDISYSKYREFAIKTLESYEDEDFRGECQRLMTIAEGDRHFIKSEYKKSIGLYEKAQAIPGNTALYDIAINLKLGVAHFYMHDLEGEKIYFDKALLLSQSYQDEIMYLVVCRTTVFTKFLRRELVECESICGVCINSRMNDALRKSSFMSIFYIILALVYYERNNIGKAEEYVSTGIELIEREGKPMQHCYTLYTGLYVYAGILLDKNNKAELEKVCTKIEELSKGIEYERIPDLYYLNKLESYFDLFKIEIFMEAGKANIVEKYISKLDYKIPQELVMFSKTLIDKGKSDDALMLLNKILISENKENQYLRLKAHIYRAEIFSQEDQYENATKDLREALTIGYENGFIRIFMFKSIKTSRMLIKTIGSMKFNKDYYKMSEYLNNIAAQYSKDKDFEIVSKREKEVLMLIEKGAKNSEIAKELFITESTAKSHILNIFSKLGVRNRVQAVAKAKELGIL